MSSKRKIKKCYSSYHPTFKASSGQQGPPASGFTPVYGSLNASANVATPNTNVDFDTVGPFSGVTLSTADNSITINSSGIYTITFSSLIELFALLRTGFYGVVFIITINGIPTTPLLISVYSTLQIGESQFDTVSRTDQLMLKKGDVIRVYINEASEYVSYYFAALVVTKVAD